jgi:hypothetical protein
MQLHPFSYSNSLRPAPPASRPVPPLAGPPWPHLALLLLLLLASRSHWLPGLALLTLCTVLAAMHARGLRIVLRVDGGGRLGVALIRHGAPVQGIAPGADIVLLLSRCCLYMYHRTAESVLSLSHWPAASCSHCSPASVHRCVENMLPLKPGS